MGLHDAELLIVELAGLEQDVVRDTDLADIMEKGPLDQRTHVLCRQPHGLADAGGVEGDTVVVGIGVTVPLGYGAAQHGKRLEVCVKEACRIVRNSPHEMQDYRVEDACHGEYYGDHQQYVPEDRPRDLGLQPGRYDKNTSAICKNSS